MLTLLWYVLVTGLAAPVWFAVFVLAVNAWDRWHTSAVIQSVPCQVCGYWFTLQRPITPYTCPDCVRDPERAARIAERIGLSRARLGLSEPKATPP